MNSCATYYLIAYEGKGREEIVEAGLGIEDFTETAYRTLLARASSTYSFGNLTSLLEGEERVAVWRHDVDISPQRALAIAQIDHESGVEAYFFFQVTSIFYSPFEAYFPDLVRTVSSLGHEVGLHFDPSSAKSGSDDDQLGRLSWEMQVLSSVLERPIRTFSIHNPTVNPSALMSEREVLGWTNASWRGWSSLAQYCSDSNGYWRFQSAHDLVAEPNVDSLYLLTHPEWWPPTLSTPYDSVLRAVQGRANATMTAYKCLIEDNGRILKGLPKA